MGVTACTACLLLFSLISAVAAGPADDLVASVSKGDYNAVLQQVGHGTSANDADGTGKLPLVLAVTRADLRTAEVLLNYRANATRVELSSGLSAVTAAFSKLNSPMAELLMKFGADPDATDGSGRTGRSLMKKNAKLQELVDRWDANGAAAFEDAPGTWTKHMHESHAMPFYYNTATGRSQFMTPPSCAWVKSMLDGHPVYTNTITHQSSWKRPAALSWKLLHAPGEHEAPYWYNYANDASATETPAELSAEMADELTYDAGSYYHNTVTKEAAWEDPSETGWRSVQDPEGRTFWYHAATGETTWERPAPLAWRPIPTDEGHTYYHNDRTADVQWEKPVDIAWEKAHFNPHVNILS